MNEAIREKVEFATQEELLTLLLRDIDIKFKKAIVLWEKGTVKEVVRGNEFCKKITEALIELQVTLDLNPPGATEQTKEALQQLFMQYGYLIKAIGLAMVRTNIEELKKCHDLYKIIMSMFIQK